MAILITKQPSDATLMVGKISGTLNVAATGATGYQWRQARDAGTTVGSTAVLGQTTPALTIPTNLEVGTYYFYCAISDEDETINSKVVSVHVVEFPEYITGAFAHAYVGACAKEIQDKFQELQVLTGITIPNNNDVLLTAQVELFMEAL